MRNVLLLPALICLSTAAVAQVSEPVAAPVKEKKICKSLDKTGSILAERTCLTKSQWELVAKKNAANAERFAHDRDAARSVTPRSPTGQ